MKIKNYYNIIFTLAILNSFSLFSKEIKIGILAKYNLKELELNLTNAKISYAGNIQTMKDGVWKVKIIEDRVQVFNSENNFKDNKLEIVSNDSFNIYAFSQGKKILRTYHGNLAIRSEFQRILLILTLPLEEYISSATYSELGELLIENNSFEEKAKHELISAQEIVIRSFILKEKNRHRNLPYEFCDLTHCIHYNGHLGKKSLQKGKYLFGKEIISGYFHSTCGGNLSGPEVFWSRHSFSNYYKRGIDGDMPNCKNSPHFNWKSNVTILEMEQILGERNIISIHLVKKDSRVRAIKFTDSLQNTRTMSISNFFSKSGNLFGWNRIKSNDFSISKNQKDYFIEGKGLGHGIGLCQWGAAQMAVNGKNYMEILKFYYPSIELKSNFR